MAKEFIVSQKSQNLGNGINGGISVVNVIYLSEYIETNPNTVLTKNPDSISWNNASDDVYVNMEIGKRYMIDLKEVEVPLVEDEEVTE